MLGKPPIFDSVDKLKETIEDYFDSITESETPSITGLALHLGFESRQSIYDYEKKGDDYSYTIKRARLRIEYFYEQNLLGKGVTGAIFALKNFGWADRQEVDHTTKGESIHPTPIKFSKSNNK